MGGIVFLPSFLPDPIRTVDNSKTCEKRGEGFTHRSIISISSWYRGYRFHRSNELPVRLRLKHEISIGLKMELWKGYFEAKGATTFDWNERAIRWFTGPLLLILGKSGALTQEII